METPVYFNAHCHSRPQENGEWVCRNAYHFLGKENLEKLQYPISVGIHPWHAETFDPILLEQFLLSLTSKNVLAIGEAGLDRSRQTPWNIQMECWEYQFNLAQTHKLPIIIHCVKAYEDFLPFCKKSEVPMMFHDFQGNEEIIRKLSDFDHVYFSFGKQLRVNPKVMALIRKVDKTKILLETDNADTPISKIYSAATNQLGWSNLFLQAQIKKNIIRFFGEKAITPIN